MVMSSVNVPALGEYLKTLRAQRQLTPGAVLRQLKDRLGRDVDRSRLWRAENGAHWPESEFLAALLDVIGGRMEDITWIQQHADATAKDGYELALRALETKVSQMTDEELQEALALFMRLKRDPKALGRWLGYGERLAGDLSPPEE